MSDIKTAHNITETELKDGTTVYVNDHVYLASEHLGEPYYIGRVMEFCTSHKRKGLQVRIAWYNRMKDIVNRKMADPCLLVATMHSDIHPVSSIRGKCTVMHKHYVANIDVYRKQPDHFYYNQLYDRYIQRVYDVVPCETVQNVPMDTLEALKSRYQFIAVEQGKAADLTVARRTCCVCQQWCQSTMSVKCAACQKSFHMSCLNPPLVRKPPKGFAWQCAYCTRQEQIAEYSNSESPVTSVTSYTRSSSSKASSPETSDSQQQTTKELSIATAATTQSPSPTTTATTPIKTEQKRQVRATRSQVRQQQQQEALSLNAMVAEDASDHTASAHGSKNKRSQATIKRERPQAQHMKMTNMWPFRYFGVNTAISEILDVNDRIYPRAKSRIGSKYQANVPDYMPPAGPSRPSCSSTSSDINDQQDMASPSSSSISSQPTTTSSSMRPVRGTDETVTVIYRPGILDDSVVDRYMDSVKQLDNIPLLPHSSDLMDRALYELELNDYDTEAAYDNMSKLNGYDFKHIVEWTPVEKEAFEKSIREHGHNLNRAKAAVETKDMADIVRYFYEWKKTDRYEPVYSEWTKVYRPHKKFKTYPRDSEREAEEARLEKENEMAAEQAEPSDLTIVPKSTYASANYHCMNCLTEQSRIWRRSPSDFDRKQTVFNKVLCNDCGVFWLKYAKIKPIPPETRINNTNLSIANSTSNGSLLGDKRKRSESHGSCIKRRLTDDDGKEHMEFDPSPCAICRITGGPPNSLYTCYACGMSVHRDCYGVKDKAEHTSWRCDPCQNKRKPVASYNYECVLCYNTTSSRQPLKMTSGYCWAHVQCALFIPEAKFVNTTTLSPVEYIGCVNPARTEAQCSLCNEQRGACVACPECNKSMHVQCAVDSHYRLLFEILPPNPKNTRHQANCPTIPAGLFRANSAAGIMVPQVFCPSHNLAGKQLIRMDERTNNEAKESALHTFCNYFKRISTNSTPAMRRYLASSENKFNTKKTPRKIPSQLDAVVDSLTMDASLSSYAGSHRSHSKAILTSSASSSSSSATASASSSQSSSPSSSRTCSQCPARFSPIWWSVGSGPYSHQRLCQRCHNKEQQPNQQHVH
ncbi:hypothetical protein MBANPS3_004368 [Mucor bainieri]